MIPTSVEPPATAGGRFPGIRTTLRSAVRWLEPLFEDGQLLDLLGVMTLLVCVLHLVSLPEFDDAIYIAAVAGILDRRVLRSAWYWFLLTAVFAVNHALLWHTLDNHKYLLTYWCLALGISRLQPDSLRVAAVNGRLLIGLCFLFATVSKLLSPEYLDGSFFHYTLLADSRFSGLSDIVGGVTGEMRSDNIAAIRDLALPYGALDSVTLQDGPRVALLAGVMTWWTIAVEGSIALLFLLPERLRITRVRDVCLLLFMFTTYPVATVVGFGRLLAVGGLAQTRNTLGVERALYLAAFVLLPAYKFPFASIFRWFAG